MVVAGLRFDTSGRSDGRLALAHRHALVRRGYTVRHPTGLCRPATLRRRPPGGAGRDRGYNGRACVRPPVLLALAVAALAVAPAAARDPAEPARRCATPPDRSVGAAAAARSSAPSAGPSAPRSVHPTRARRAAAAAGAARLGRGAARTTAPPRAARYFALPAIVSQGVARRSRRCATGAHFNDALAVRRAAAAASSGDGRFVVGTFVLTRRPEHSCPATGSACGSRSCCARARSPSGGASPPGRAQPGPARPESAPDPPPSTLSA